MQLEKRNKFKTSNHIGRRTYQKCSFWIMEKKASRVIIRLTPIICALLLTLLALFYEDFYGSNVVPFDQSNVVCLSLCKILIDFLTAASGFVDIVFVGC